MGNNQAGGREEQPHSRYLEGTRIGGAVLQAAMVGLRAARGSFQREN